MSLTTSIPRPKRWDHPFWKDAAPHQEFTETELADIISAPPFDNVDVSGFRKSLPLADILKNDARIVDCEPGDIIFRRNDWGNSAFFLLSGQMRVELETPETAIPGTMLGQQQTPRRGLFNSIAQLWRNNSTPECRTMPSNSDAVLGSRNNGSDTKIFLQDIPAVLDQYRTGVVQPGQWFGELAALGRTPRPSTVFAETSARLLEIRWQGLRDIMRYDKRRALLNQIESSFREHALEEFLRNAPLFQGLNTEQMTRLMKAVEFQTFGEYGVSKPFKELAKQGFENNYENEALVLEEGDYPNFVFMVRSGLARLTSKYHHGERTVGYLTPGQSYGFSEISNGMGQETAIPYQHSVRAISYLSAILIPTSAVEDILLLQRDSLQPAQLSGQSTESVVKQFESPTSESLFNFLIEERYVQGRETMVIDMDRCVRCDDCVRACAAAHDNNPRFIRHGPMHGQHMLANACLHCADPVCMVECPTGAIHTDFSNGLILINDQTCIGCAQCANNCPYDAIRMVEISDEQGRKLVDQKSQQPLLQATKCDLCVDQLGGPACQNACSHDALQRVNMNDIYSLEKLF